MYALQGAQGSAQAHWTFVEKLFIQRHMPSAVQVVFHGHAVGCLGHYTTLATPWDTLATK